jgi:hypothetical protein
MSQQEQADLSQYFFRASAADFMTIPGSPIAYWASPSLINALTSGARLGDTLDTAQGMKTLDNERFIRQWQEVSFRNFTRDVNPKRWVPANHGGGFRKWYGYNESVLNWRNDGEEIKALAVQKYNSVTRTVTGMGQYFKSGITWSSISSDLISVRGFKEGFVFTNAGMCAFGNTRDLNVSMALMNSKVGVSALRVLAPSVNFGPNQISELRITDLRNEFHVIEKNTNELTDISKEDWNSYETSWDFSTPPWMNADNFHNLLKASYQKLLARWQDMAHQILRLEECNNRILIKAYGLDGELPPEIPLNEITLTCNPHYRYGSDKSEAELETLLQCDTIRELVSYAIGCMMGRYSLDKPGLILASQGETLQDYLAQIPSPTFTPDNDAILPLTDQEWFADDASNRFGEFVRTVWSDEHLQENLKFVADSLCLHAIKPKSGESALDTIRRYLSGQFYKDHLKTYKKRPIYWLFSSGKHNAFECLVYLHRYNEGTLARMRTEYVIPLSAKLHSYATKLAQDIESSASTAEKKRLEKELATLHNQQVELAAFDEKLRHYADQRISLDLDDGVKVNYGKFGDLLSDVKAVTGDKEE